MSPDPLERGQIVVVGGALVDVRATARAGWTPGVSLPGTVRILPGGSGRNVAVDLARLGHRVALLSAVGTDPLGDWLLQVTSAAGVEVGHVRRTARTGLFVSVGPPDGEAWCVADAGGIENLAVDDLGAWRPLVETAALVISDANLSETAQRALAAMVGERPRVLLATSPAKAPRLRPVLPGAAVVVCNRAEALALTGLPPTLSWQALAAALLTDGVACVVITQGRSGVGIVTAQEEAFAPAREVEVVDPTGAGDAVAAVAAHAHLAGMEPDRTAHLAAEAASLAVRSEDNTPADLAAVLQRT
ncbi:MAG: PfkB family carbohydrate kinase [Armatimonadota bacterium]|nr:PfkB family carbohydrate kinase [Armatimonadota bacterium]MDR7518185.1 PfkB family carbohydrate kinase [Armatimonadota bacterium]MDR7548439.1 PfkB family carbohydrate kinase [Armatimonadota bacterium]